MSKSVKRNNKYYADDMYEILDNHEEHREHLKEKRLRSALRSKNWDILQRMMETEE
jgi:hypothetical protein